MVSVYNLAGADIEIDPMEVLRYLGYVRDRITEEDIEMVRQAVIEASPHFAPAACYDRFQVQAEADDMLCMPYGRIHSSNLTTNLTGCQDIYIFAATIGTSYDRYIRQKRVRTMAGGAIANAIGAAAVENVCDRLNTMLKEEEESRGCRLKPRYSPGYGDLELSNQTGIFRVLNPERHAGITLGDNLLMTPEKSVTAIIGIYR